MSSKAMSLKAKIKTYAKNSNIAAQVVLQNYMFERFLERLSESEYCDKFIVKGGMLISSIVGLDTRATMDLDTTLRNLPLTKEQIHGAISSICKANLNDDVVFELKSIDSIRKDDPYGGYCVRIDAVYDTIVTPLSIDISTGDVITPAAVKYEFGGIFDEKVRISLWGYNIETVLAEKVETILSRGILTTRPRDFYDVYILGTTQQYSANVFREALKATSIHRGSFERIQDVNQIIEQISSSADLVAIWDKYRKKFSYAKDITYEKIIDVLKKLLGNNDVMRDEYNVDELNPSKNPHAGRFEINVKKSIAEEIKQGLLEAIEYEKGNLEANSSVISTGEDNHLSV